MSGSGAEVAIKNFAGLNLLDAADQVSDNEFVQLQNVWQPSKGVFSRRFGSVIDVSSFPLTSRVSGLWRHVGQHENITLYHCVPDATPFPDNTVDLVLTESASVGGTIFDGGAVTTIRVCYTWIGCGMEQSFNTKNRAGYVATNDINAWAQVGHQSITLGANDSGVTVKAPVTFPSGVRGANIFVSVGTTCQMTYVGTITTPGGTLLFKRFIGPHAANADTSAVAITATVGSGGSLKAGTYYVGVSWCCDNNQKENPASTPNPLSMVLYTALKTVVVSGDGSQIILSPVFLPSTNGAKTVCLFIGTQPQTLAPMSFVGLAATGDSVVVSSMPQHNGQSHPYTIGANTSNFMNVVNSFGTTNGVRSGFMLAKSSGSIYEVFISRSLYWMAASSGLLATYDPTTNTSTANALSSGYLGYLKTQNDSYTTSPQNWGLPVQDPVFAYLQGLSYFVNGIDVPWLTDGYSLGQVTNIYAATQTILPPTLQTIFSYQNALVGSSVLGNQLYSSNANAPQNWATGGTGTLLRFVTIGDAHGSGIKAVGTFTPGGVNIPATATTNNPGSYLIGFKKNGTWMIASIPDPASSSVAGLIGGQVASPMVQISGNVGCVAYRSVVHTPSGTAFVGSDANVYLINSISQPIKIGNKVQNALIHMVGNDAAMALVTAVYHDRHYKISYPSPANITAGTYVNDSELWADLRTENGPIKWVGPQIGRNIASQVVLAQDGDNLSRLVCDGAVVRTYTADSISSLADLAANGSAQGIAVSIISKIYRFKSESHAKRYFGAFIDLYIDDSYTNNVLFSAKADSFWGFVNRNLSSGGATWDSSQWDQSNYADADWQGFSFLFDSSTNLIGRTFQFTLSTSDQAPFVLASVTPLLKAEKRKVVN